MEEKESRISTLVKIVQPKDDEKQFAPFSPIGVLFETLILY